MKNKMKSLLMVKYESSRKNDAKVGQRIREAIESYEARVNELADASFELEATFSEEIQKRPKKEFVSCEEENKKLKEQRVELEKKVRQLKSERNELNSN
ncbi:unnamed protein product [Rhizophagus irregularis]|nr:unnamed protein product [Rhizophagus irregularis]